MDNWLGDGPLAQFSTNSTILNNTTIAELTNKRQWNWNILTQLDHVYHLASILSTKIHLQQYILDQVVWTHNSDESFSCTPASNKIRKKRNKNHFNSLILRKSIPFRVSFILWRIVRGELLTNNKLINFFVEPAHYFCCCKRSSYNTIDHTLNNGFFLCL